VIKPKMKFKWKIYWNRHRSKLWSEILTRWFTNSTA